MYEDHFMSKMSTIVIITIIVVVAVSTKNKEKSKCSTSSALLCGQIFCDEEIPKLSNWEKNISFDICNCSAVKEQIAPARFFIGAVYNDILKCKVRIHNKNKQKFKNDFLITWRGLSATGVEVMSKSGYVKEFLLPEAKLDWKERDEYFLISNKEEFQRVKKVECTVSRLEAVN